MKKKIGEMKNMIEKYIAFKMFFEYELPLILLALGGIIFIGCIVVGKIIDTMEKREKKRMEKYFGEEEDD
jgi:hypothetical protein